MIVRDARTRGPNLFLKLTPLPSASQAVCAAVANWIEDEEVSVLAKVEMSAKEELAVVYEEVKEVVAFADGV